MFLRKGARKSRRKRSGQAIVLVSAALAILMGFAALAVDVGYFQGDRRKMQTATDSAAIAGAREVQNGNSSDLATAADNDAALNGFTNGTNKVTITVNNPPKSGSYTSDSNAVEVIIAQPQPTFFLRALGIDTVTISTRAVATLKSGPDCIYTLNRTADDAIDFNGAADVNTSCGIIDDSDSSSAFNANGAGNFDTTGIGIVGGLSSNGAITFNPQPMTGVAPANDPLAYLQEPAVPTGQTFTNVSFNGATITTIQPGTYYGGININGASDITLAPGLYIIDGGGITVNGASTINGNGVTIFVTGDSSHAYGGITINGATSDDLVAPTTGDLAGILFFQDRNISASTAQANPNVFNGASSAVFQGALYFPTTSLTYNGASGAAYTLLVADTIRFNGATSTSVGNDYSSLPDGSPIKAATLVE